MRLGQTFKLRATAAQVRLTRMRRAALLRAEAERRGVYLYLAAGSDLQPAAASQYRQRRILVVDHETGVREIICALLEEMDYDVISCCAVIEARAVLARQAVDLLVADETMFESGRALADHAGQLGVPTLLMSSYNEIKEELTQGPRVFIGKPFRREELREQVRRLLENPEDARHRSLRSAAEHV